MINEINARKYCCEDISLIENYDRAMADSKTWDIHHRAETDEVLNHKELKAQGRYFNRPASELIFLTRSAHKQLHFDSGTCEHMRNNGRKGALKQSKTILQFTLDGTFVREWPSIMEIKRKLKFNQGHICECCLGKRKSAHKFIWRHKEAA